MTVSIGATTEITGSRTLCEALLSKGEEEVVVVVGWDGIGSHLRCVSTNKMNNITLGGKEGV